jgi:hypothetical protein
MLKIIDTVLTGYSVYSNILLGMNLCITLCREMRKK